MRMRQLEAFRSTIIAGSVSRAAEALLISQPTASRLLSDLETSLGFPLFARRRGKIEPTPEGLAFYRRLDDVYEALSGLNSVAKQIKKNREESLKIAATNALAVSVLPTVLERFHQMRPNVQVSLDARDVAGLFRALSRAEADIVFSNAAGGQPGTVQKPLIEVDFICALPPGHHLASQKIVEAHQLRDENLVMFDDVENLSFTGHKALVQKHGFENQITTTTTVSSVAYSMVRQGLGIGILEPFSAPFWATQGVEIRPFRPVLRYSYTVSFISNDTRTALAKEFAEETRKYLAELVQSQNF